jgi:glucose-1-phosphate thymidylyltransferase
MTNAVLLAAGYGTRLYPLTNDTPKALLTLDGRTTLMDAIADDLVHVPDLDRVVMVSNHRFAGQFQQWAARRGQSRARFEVIDDGTETNETRLGAIRDLLLGLDRLASSEDVLVMGTDNLFSWPVADFVRAAQGHRPSATVAVHEVATLDEASRMGVIRTDARGRIVELLEKPKQPPTRLVSLAVYYFPAAMHRRFREFLDGGGNPDAPGFFLEWLVKVEPVSTFVSRGQWLDIGSHESYEQAKAWWAGRRTGR